VPFPCRVGCDADAGDSDGPRQSPKYICGERLEEVEAREGSQKEGSELGRKGVEDVSPINRLLQIIK
jgi:hypothetical protein